MFTKRIKTFLMIMLPLFVLLLVGISSKAYAAGGQILINYNFEDGVTDCSGNGNDGTAVGSVSYVPGHSGKAISLDGDSWICLPENLILNNTSFTISMRFKTTSTGGLFGYQNFAAETVPISNVHHVPVLCILPNGKLYAEMWTGSSMAVYSSGAVNDGAWHRVVMTSGSNSIRVYLDGSDIGGQIGVPQHLDMNFNQIGTNAAWSRTDAQRDLPDYPVWNGFTGLIDDFVFYSNAQSAEEIAKQTQTISFDPLPGKTPGDAPFDLNATSTSGLPVSYTSSDTSVATISGSTVTIVGAGATQITASQGGDDTYSAAPEVVRTLTVSMPVTVYTHRDGTLFDAPGVVTLKNGATEYTMSGLGGTYTADVAEGTYDVMVGGEDTGVDISVSSGGANTETVNYYTVSFSVTDAGSASGSTISATADGSAIATGATVLAGEPVVMTAAGAGASSYTYVWSGDGTSGETTAALTIASIGGSVDADCTVTGATLVTVTFDAEGGSVSPSTQIKMYGSTYGKKADGATDEPLPTPTRSGYAFKGWWTGDDGTGTKVTNTATVSNASDHTLHAKWDRDDVEAASITLSRSSLRLAVNETATLAATVRPRNASNVRWSSSNGGIAAVDQSGHVTAKAVGAAKIIARTDGVRAVCTVTVVAPESTSAAENTVPADTPSPASPTLTPSPTVTPLPRSTPSPGTSETATPAETAAPSPAIPAIVPSAVRQDKETGGISVEINTQLLPSGTEAVQLPNGEVIRIEDTGNGKIRLQISEDDLNQSGTLEIVTLDDTDKPSGVYNVQVLGSSRILDKSSGISIWVWILISTGVVGLILFLLLVLFKKREREDEEEGVK